MVTLVVSSRVVLKALSVWCPNPHFFHLNLLPLLNNLKENYKCSKIISYISFAILFPKFKNPIAIRKKKEKKRFWYVQGFIFHYIVCQTIRSINQCVRGSFIFKARRLLEKNYFKLYFLFPKEKLFALIFQVGPDISIILPTSPYRKIVPWVKKRNYAIFFIGSFANFGLSHKRLSWTVVPGGW